MKVLNGKSGEEITYSITFILGLLFALDGAI